MIRLTRISARGLLVAAALASAVPTAAASYSDLVALALSAPVVVRATVVKAQRLSPRDAPGVAPGFARMLISAATNAAIAAPAAVPPRFSYLADVALDARGKPPKLNGADYLLFLRAGDAPDQFALVDAHAEVAWSAAAEATVKAALTADRSGTVPTITRVTSAFRVPGAVPGEAESQFFLATADRKPVSLVVLTRPGQPRRLTIALGDVIDDAAAGVQPQTLLWYRLACALPPALPATISADDGLADDYRFIRTSLGACGRTF